MDWTGMYSLPVRPLVVTAETITTEAILALTPETTLERIAKGYYLISSAARG
jgi:hypothetical protein